MIYITTHEKNVTYTKLIKEYFDKFEVSYMFVYGKGCINPISPFIEVDCKECYENLPLKTFLILKHFIESNKDRMIKMDDDTFLDLEKFKKISFEEDYVGMFRTHPTSIKNSIYHWYKIKNKDYKTPKKSIQGLIYAEGAFYSLSKKAALLAYSKGEEFYINTPDTYLGEDVKIGLALSACEISKKDIKYENNMNYEISNNFLCIHPVHFTFFKKLQNTSSEEKRLLLQSYNILNNNIRREKYLTNTINELKL